MIFGRPGSYLAYSDCSMVGYALGISPHLIPVEPVHGEIAWEMLKEEPAQETMTEAPM
jgi:hypothetical protein